MVEPRVIVISGPSGAGKSTIVRYLLDTIPNLVLSISATTRKPRPSEKNGREYFFLETSEFEKLVKEGEFLEYEEIYPGKFYGTLKKNIDSISSSGKMVIFDIDAFGGFRIKEYYGEKCLSVFLLPPSIEDLRTRLIGRRTETKEDLEIRIAKSAAEIDLSKNYDIQYINEDLDRTKEEIGRLVSDFLGFGNK